ncbi:MAG: dTDP-4-dehydrorhamnose 3,5-epimerase family protein [Acidimicrobiales bacterium]
MTWRPAPSEVIAGVYVVDPAVHGDERGIFVETYRREWFPNGRDDPGSRADRQAGAIVGLHYHLHQADYWYVPVRHGAGRPARPARRWAHRRGDPHAGPRSAGRRDAFASGVYIPPGWRTASRRR